jgi:hypothetical protein
MTGRPRQPRQYPIGPLLEQTGHTPSSLGAHVGASGTDINRAAEHGLTVSQADMWATRWGFHPAEIWAAWFDITSEKEPA